MIVLIENSLFFPNVIGGAEISSHLLGQELRRRGVTAHGVATTGRCGSDTVLTTRPTADGLGTIYEAPGHGLCDLLPSAEPGGRSHLLVRGLHHFASVHSPRWLRLFDEVLGRVRPDIVHTNTLVGLTPAIWSACRRRGVPVVHTLRDYHLLCPRTTLLHAAGTDCTDPRLPCRLLAALKLRRTADVQAVTAPTRFVLDRHLDAGGFPGARTYVVANALETWPAEIPERAATGPVRGLFLGQLDVHKGLPLLTAALTQVFADPACDALGFDFAGAGPLADDVRAFCAAHPGRATYHGMVGGPDKERLLREAAIMVVPSVWAEPFSRSIIDGFSWGLPAIGCRQGGIPEVISDGCDGQLVEPDTASLAAALRTYVTDAQLRLSHGRTARRNAERFSLQRQVDAFMAIYAEVLAAVPSAAHDPDRKARRHVD